MRECSVTVGPCAWLTETDHPVQRSITIGKPTVKAPLPLV
jgi:hypothetical protein